MWERREAELVTRRGLLKGAASVAAITLTGIGDRGDGEAMSMPEVRNNLKIGLFQHVPTKWALHENLASFLRGVEEASMAGVELLITPECFLDGYASPDKTSSRERLFGIAQEVGNSKCLERVGREARMRKMSIVFGFTQKAGRKLHNAAGLWDSGGRLVGVYHKTHLKNHDLQYDPGEDLPVFKSPWGPLGIMICADRRWPETARALRLKGARLLLCPSYGMNHEANEWWMRTRSYENDCFLAFAHPEVGFVSDPDGNLSGKLEKEDAGLLAVDLDLSNADKHRHLDYRRLDLYEVICKQQ